MPRKYERPPFLRSRVTQEMYERWLRRKAQAHVKRDRQRGNKTAGGEAYRGEIHRAVLESGGLDAYTGEKLDWKRISRWDNDLSQKNKHLYKHEFALLPTVDHVGDGIGPVQFQICGWRTNDAKNDLALRDFLRLCQAVLEHHGYGVAKGGR